MTLPETPMATEKQSQQETLTAFHALVEKVLQDLRSAQSEAEVKALRPILDDLRRQVTEGVEWWVGYDTRQAGEAVRRVEEAFDEATSRMRPRARFRFRRTVEEPVVAEKPVTASKGEVPVGIVLDEKDVKDGVLTCSDMAGRDMTVRDLRDTKVIVGDVGAVRFVELTGCSVETGLVNGSVWVGKCDRCQFRTRCRQLRVHETTASDFVVDVESGPVIERCEKVRFGPLRNGDTWKDVKDFSWLREGQSPNWTVID